MCDHMPTNFRALPRPLRGETLRHADTLHGGWDRARKPEKSLLGVQNR